MKYLLILFIKFYKKFISSGLPPSCRFYPSCSTYSLQVIQKYGVIKGLFLAIKRIIKCTPLHPGGYDPIP